MPNPCVSKILFLELFLFAITSRIWITEGSLIIVNDVFDEYSSNLSALVKVHSIDPYKLPDVERQFKDSWCQPDIKLSNGFMSGLSRFNRSGEILMSDKNSSMLIHGTVSFPELHTRYDYSASCSIVRFNGVLSVSLKDVKVKFLLTDEVSISSKTTAIASKIVRIGSKEVDVSTSDSLLMDFIKEKFSNKATEGILKMSNKAASQVMDEAMAKLSETIPQFIEEIRMEMVERKNYYSSKVKCLNESGCYRTLEKIMIDKTESHD